MINKIYTIAVLITCHNRRKKTIECLKSLYNNVYQNDISVNVFLVDDGSTDGTSDAIKLEFPEVIIIQGSGQLYWNRGMHLAWSSATKTKKYDYYLWLNDDTLLFKNSIKLMFEYSQISGNQRIIVGATCSSHKNIVTYGGYTFPNNMLTPDGTWQDCDFFNGNIVLIPSYVYSKVGLLDNRFRHSLGDFDFGMRAHKLGFTHVLSPNCLGYCEHHETIPIWRNHTIALNKRLKNLYSPLGNNPFEFLFFDLRHKGLFIAIIHFVTIHLRSVFPILWGKE
ncbi:MAG: glycosyltransferase family 2 protein [Paludibacter sp.]